MINRGATYEVPSNEAYGLLPVCFHSCPNISDWFHFYESERVFFCPHCQGQWTNEMNKDSSPLSNLFSGHNHDNIRQMIPYKSNTTLRCGYLIRYKITFWIKVATKFKQKGEHNLAILEGDWTNATCHRKCRLLNNHRGFFSAVCTRNFTCISSTNRTCPVALKIKDVLI